MIRDAWLTFATIRPGEEIIIVKVGTGAVQNRWQAQRVTNAVRTKVPIEKMAFDVVVTDGEPVDDPVLFGSSLDAETFVKSIARRLARFRWQPTKLDW